MNKLARFTAGLILIILTLFAGFAIISFADDNISEKINLEDELINLTNELSNIDNGSWINTSQNISSFNVIDYNCTDTSSLICSVDSTNDTIEFEFYNQSVVATSLTEKEWLELELTKLNQRLEEIDEGIWLNTFINISKFISYNYTCEEIGFSTSKVITPGIHNQMYEFGTLVAYANNLATGISCNLTAIGTCGENATSIFYLSNFTDAHASMIPYDYNYEVCCMITGDAINITVTNQTEGGDTAVLGFSGIFDAHVEEPGYGDYYNITYISMDYGTLDCGIYSSCPAQYECLATLSNESTDAHVANCSTDGNQYDDKLCCGFSNLAPEIFEIELTPEEPTTQNDLNCSFKINENEIINVDNVTWYWINGSTEISTGTLVDIDNNTWYNITLDYTNLNYGDNWTCKLIPNDEYDLGRNVSVTVGISINGTPIINSSRIYSATNSSIENLQGFCNATDINEDTLTYYYKWFRNDTLIFNSSTAGGQPQGVEENVYNISYENLAVGDIWILSCLAFDGIENSSWLNSSNITIINTAPTINLTYPTNELSIINRSPMMIWNGTDINNNILTYYLNITCHGSCPTNDDRNYTIINDIENYTLPTPLLYLSDDNYYYNWTMQAFDGLLYSNWTPTWSFSVESYVSISLNPDNMDFGSVLPGTSNSTTNDAPPPIIIHNDGNCFINITLNATNYIWETISIPSDNFLFKIDNVTEEPNSYNWTSAVTSWTQINTSIDNLLIIPELDFNNSKDSVEFDLNLTVPLSEPTGSKQANFTFTGEYSS